MFGDLASSLMIRVYSVLNQRLRILVILFGAAAQSVRRLLADAEEDVRAADGIEAVEDGGVGAVGEGVGENRHGGPCAGDEVGGELRHERVGGVGACGEHDDIGGDGHRDNGVASGRRGGGGREDVDDAVEAMDITLIIERAGIICGRNGEGDGARTHDLRACVGVFERVGAGAGAAVGDDDHGMDGICLHGESVGVPRHQRECLAVIDVKSGRAGGCDAVHLVNVVGGGDDKVGLGGCSCD